LSGSLVLFSVGVKKSHHNVSYFQEVGEQIVDRQTPLREFATRVLRVREGLIA
jgi:hypothetical protein